VYPLNSAASRNVLVPEILLDIGKGKVNERGGFDSSQDILLIAECPKREVLSVNTIIQQGATYGTLKT